MKLTFFWRQPFVVKNPHVIFMGLIGSTLAIWGAKINSNRVP